MTTPIRPVPEEAERWISRARWLRRVDAGVAWIGLWGALVSVAGPARAKQAAVLSLVLLALGFVSQPLRVLWRPVSGCVGLAVSRRLRPGDRAWYVRSGRADLVLVTARHGSRMVIATSDLDVDEVLSVRRTRVLLLPADGAQVKRRPP